MKMLAPLLWTVAGILMMIPSVFGDDDGNLVPIGIMFIVIGITSREYRSKEVESK